MLDSAATLARHHELWLGLVQPTDGLVVSVPVLVEAQLALPPSAERQERLRALCVPGPDGAPVIADLPRFLAELLELGPDLAVPVDPAGGDAFAALSCYAAEGRQTVRPSYVVRNPDAPAEPPTVLVWELPLGLALDRPETVTGPWEYPPAAKLDRLLRATRVPIGLLCNGAAVRLVYAPHGESSGSITFRVADMVEVGGRPILDALCSLLAATRLYGVAAEHALPALLARSRQYQGTVTSALAEQVKGALEALLAGFDAAARRDGSELLGDRPELAVPPGEHVYGGLLTALMRLVFTLYAEDTGLLPVEHPLYAEHLSVLGLHAELQNDAAAHPDSMGRRFGAWSRLLALWRAVHDGAAHDDLAMPPRRGELFDPGAYPFLESASGEAVSAATRAAARVPTVDDGTVWKVLDALVRLDGQRLSYRALDVEQIGSVYEALMGYSVVRLPGPAACLGDARVWVTVDELRAVRPAGRAAWLKDTCALAKARAEQLARSFEAAGADDGRALGAMGEVAVKGEGRAPRLASAGTLVLQPGPERRRTSSHYTPRSLTAPIVERTLAPLIKAMTPDGAEGPPSARLLELKVCDPAMGSGAFLVEACRWLAEQLVAAWTREGVLREVVKSGEDPVMHARRLVAQRCLYGVDRNPYAVGLAKLSLWLVTLARALPFTFLDHALRCGDSLVGLDLEQIVSFHWAPTAQVETCRVELEATLQQAIDARQRILALAEDESPAAQREKEWLLRDAEDALDRVRLIGDLVVGAFFSAGKDKAREAERRRRLDLVTAWLAAGGAVPEELRLLQGQMRERTPAFHWMVEFPEVFWVQRADPLAGDEVGGKAWIDAFVGNPPFMGKNGVADMGGPEYVDWLKVVTPGSHGNADYVAHFFRRTGALLGEHGTVGLIATNTISQGDTRATGLQAMLADGFVVYDATRSMPWPGDAAVAVAVVHLAKGSAQDWAAVRLDGEMVRAVSSRLRAGAEVADPVALEANAELSFQGSIVLGLGFTLTPAQRHELLARDPKNSERIFPYLGGEEMNENPAQSYSRYVINLSDLSLDQAERWPDLLKIVREKVKPARDENNRDTYRKYWWQFGEKRPALYAAMRAVSRVIAIARTAKHHAFAFQPTQRIFSENLVVFVLDAYSSFSALQSSLHRVWVSRLSSTLETRQGYRSSDCFENFPFPQPDPRTVIPALEDIGQRLYDARARYMVDTDQGLTKTYNALKDPACTDPRVLALRALHEELDRAVLAAYGWSDIPVPPYCPLTDADHAALATFEDTVLDRLFALNATRAAAERAAGLTPGKRPRTEDA